jgi:hypothetical protein
MKLTIDNLSNTDKPFDDGADAGIAYLLKTGKIIQVDIEAWLNMLTVMKR